MIEDQRSLFCELEGLIAETIDHFDGIDRASIRHHGVIDLCHNDLTRLHSLTTGMLRENFFNDG
jgi:hypothetical protein